MGLRRWSLLIAAAILAACGGSANALPPEVPPQLPPETWNLVFEDRFDGQIVDDTAWYRYNGRGHNGNGLRVPEAITVQDGLLVITAAMNGSTLVSGGMGHRQNYLYGRFEFRVRTEADPSKATSGVVLTWPQSERWPIDGELDIYETTTSDIRSPFHSFLHYGASNQQKHFVHQADATQWHTMAMEWWPDRILIYRDEALVWSMTDPVAVPQVPHHLCIQLDAFKQAMGNPVKLYVDWVKVYQWG